MAAPDILLIVVVVAAFVAISAFVGVAVASHDSHRRYPGTKFDRFRDIAVMNVPAIPFLALLFASSISDLDNGRFFTPILALCACLLYTSPSPRDKRQSRMPSSA